MGGSVYIPEKTLFGRIITVTANWTRKFGFLTFNPGMAFQMGKLEASDEMKAELIRVQNAKKEVIFCTLDPDEDLKSHQSLTQFLHKERSY